MNEFLSAECFWFTGKKPNNNTADDPEVCMRDDNTTPTQQQRQQPGEQPGTSNRKRARTTDSDDITDEEARSARAALETVINPNKRAHPFHTLSLEAQAKRSREQILPITKVIEKQFGLANMPDYDLNKLAGIPTGVRRYEHRAEAALRQLKAAIVEEYRTREEERLRSRSALACMGRGLSFSAVADIRHAECKEARPDALARGRLRAEHAAHKPHQVWFASEAVLVGFEAAVGITAEWYLALPRGTDEEREVAETYDEHKIRYYADCTLKVCPQGRGRGE